MEGFHVFPSLSSCPSQKGGKQKESSPRSARSGTGRKSQRDCPLGTGQQTGPAEHDASFPLRRAAPWEGNLMEREGSKGFFVSVRFSIGVDRFTKRTPGSGVPRECKGEAVGLRITLCAQFFQKSDRPGAVCDGIGRGTVFPAKEAAYVSSR